MAAGYKVWIAVNRNLSGGGNGVKSQMLCILTL